VEVAVAFQIASANSAKPVLATFMGVQGTLPLSHIPTYTFPESAAVALAHVTQYGEWRRKPPAESPQLAGFDRDAVRATVAHALEAGGGWLDPAATEGLLSAAGITIAEGRVAHTAEEAERVAGEIGFPVAIKGLGSSLLHKTEAGAVKLRLPDGAAVREAFTDLRTRLAERLEGVLVQRMIPSGVEMVVGGLNDQSLGPVIMAGTGGVFVDLLGDTVFRMCPLTDDDARELIEDLKGRRLLRGFRGAPPADEQAFRSLLISVSQLLDVCPEIEEMDLNPVMVLREGAVAADVRIKIGQPRAGVRSRRITY
jgi:acyl-CoA synthetase (NDP forming)